MHVVRMMAKKLLRLAGDWVTAASSIEKAEMLIIFQEFSGQTRFPVCAVDVVTDCSEILKRCYLGGRTYFRYLDQISK